MSEFPLPNQVSSPAEIDVTATVVGTQGLLTPALANPDITNWSRRAFVAGASAAGFVLAVRPQVLSALPRTAAAAASASAGAAAAADAAPAFAPNVYLAFETDNTIRMTVHRSEMGQGARTSLVMMVAEELGVEPRAITLEQAVGDKKYGDQNTDGSTTVRVNWEPIRQAGAAAREMLVAAAAKKWGVAADACGVAGGAVVHSSGKRATFGELAAAAAVLEVPKEPKLTDRKQWKVLGKKQALVDVPAIIRGQAVYGIDVQLPGMRFASIERSPTVAGKPRSFDPAPALAVAGVEKVFELPAHPQHFKTFAGVAVVASNTWAAMQGRQALDITWDSGGATESSVEFRKRLEEKAAGDGKAFREEGDYAAAKAGAVKTLSARYHAPHLVHAPMEPLAATAVFKDGACEVWAPTQDPQTARQRVAAVLGVGQDQVTVHVTMLGGGFGRKSKPDFILEAVQIAKQMPGVPIKLVWSREDEVRHGYYRAQNVQQLEATLDANNRLTGWRHHSAFPTIVSTFMATATQPSDFEIGMGATNMPYRVPNVRVEGSGIASDLRIGWLRSVCNTFQAVGVNCFVDEIAEAVGKDPVAYRLELLGEPRQLSFSPHDQPYGLDTGRLSRVIRECAEMSKWGKGVADGRAQGFASHFSFLTYVAMAVQASLDAEGKVKTHQVDCVVDCGIIVNPDTVVAQIEGAVVFGLSMAYYGEITAKNGAVEQSNFHDYEMLRLPQMPVVNVKLVESDAPPSGMGEPGVPPVAPALMGALYKLTGKRLYDLPLKNHGLA